MYINYIFNGRSEGQTMEQLKKSSRKVRRPNYQMTRKVSHMPAFIPQSASRSCSFRTLFVTVRSSPPFAWLSSPPVSASPGAVPILMEDEEVAVASSVFAYLLRIFLLLLDESLVFVGGGSYFFLGICFAAVYVRVATAVVVQSYHRPPSTV